MPLCLIIKRDFHAYFFVNSCLTVVREMRRKHTRTCKHSIRLIYLHISTASWICSTNCSRKKWKIYVYIVYEAKFAQRWEYDYCFSRLCNSFFTQQFNLIYLISEINKPHTQETDGAVFTAVYIRQSFIVYFMSSGNATITKYFVSVIGSSTTFNDSFCAAL